MTLQEFAKCLPLFSNISYIQLKGNCIFNGKYLNDILNSPLSKKDFMAALGDNDYNILDITVRSAWLIITIEEI